MKKQSWVRRRLSNSCYSGPAVFICAIALTSFVLPVSAQAGSNNTFYGQAAGIFVNSDDNSLFGSQALTGGDASESTGVGFGALRNFNGATQNTAIGSQAMSGFYDPNCQCGGSTGSYNTATGFASLYSVLNGTYNTANGWEALYSNTSGGSNTAMGAQSLQNNTGNYNTGSGAQSLLNNTTGYSNTADGVSALYANVVGHDNTAQGYGALSHNTGSSNIGIGSSAGSSLTTGSNNIDIGNAGKAGESGKIRIGAANKQTATFVAGIYGVAEPVASGIKAVYINSTGQLGTTPPASSARFKEAIKPMDKASQGILNLKPVTFRYKDDTEKTPQFGLIAEEVAKVNPDLVIRNENGDIYTVRYDAVNAMLLNEFLKEHQEVQEQRQTIAELKSAIADQKALRAQQQKQIEALTAAVQKVSDRLELQAAEHRSIAEE